MLTTREWATVTWLAILALLILRTPSGRDAVVRLVRIVLSPVLLIPLALYMAWVAAGAWLAANSPLWQPSMAKDAVLFTVPALVLFGRAFHAGTEPRFFRHRVLDAIGVSALAQFYTTLGTLPFVVEFVIQPVAAVALYLTSTATDAASRRVGWVMLGVVAVGVFWSATQAVLAPSFDWAQAAESLVLTAWLTLWALPAIYLVSLVAGYSDVFSRMNIGVPGFKASWRAKLAVLSVFHVRHVRINNFQPSRDLSRATGFREARAAIRAQFAADRARADHERDKVANLARFAGVDGTDAFGRRLDRREFKETVATLERLALEQWTNYYGENGYQPDLLERRGTVLLRGLPDDHGISLVVSRSARSYYAWRRTVSGWVFAIGAAGPPPDERFYAGPEPPTSFPRASGGWTEEYDRSADWEDDPLEIPA